MRIGSIAAACWVLVCAGAGAQSREPNHRVTNSITPQTSGGFGENVAGLGDFDGDGCCDYAVAAKNWEPFGVNNGRVYLHSGKTGSVIRTFDGIQPGAEFGMAMADAGDVNGDGKRDLVVTARSYDLPGNANVGRVTVFDGQTGAELWSNTGPGGGDYGRCVGVINDGSLDGTSAIVVGHPGWASPSFLGVGRVVYLDPATGTYLDDEEGVFGLDGMGESLATRPGVPSMFVGSTAGRVYAVDGPFGNTMATLRLNPIPGNQDAPSLALVVGATALTSGLAVGRRFNDTNGLANNGTVEFFPAGGGGTATLTIDGDASFDGLGADVIAGDFDGDGEEEVGYYSGGPNVNEGRFRVAKLDGTVIDDVITAGAGDASYAALRDVTGDGRDEWIQGVASGLSLIYEAQVFARGMSETLHVDPITTRFEYLIDGGAPSASAIQLTLFSISGTSPGTLFEPDKPLFPLNLDTFTNDALMLLGTPTFPDSLSFLDGNGVVTTNVVVPTPLALLATGFTFLACSVILDFPSLIISAVTNPVRSVFP